MPLPYLILPTVQVPADVREAAMAYDVSWSRREVVNIFRSGRWTAPRRDAMSDRLCEFLDELCLREQVAHRNIEEDSLLRFGDVERHKDDGFYAGTVGTPARFLQVVVAGDAELRFPGVRDRALRRLALTPGLVFVMNPKIHHAVHNAEPYGVATLSAVVAYRL